MQCAITWARKTGSLVTELVTMPEMLAGCGAVWARRAVAAASVAQHRTNILLLLLFRQLGERRQVFGDAIAFLDLDFLARFEQLLRHLFLVPVAAERLHQLRDVERDDPILTGANGLDA